MAADSEAGAGIDCPFCAKVTAVILAVMALGGLLGVAAVALLWWRLT